ncbi:MAG: hypothetical protein JJT81_04045 [Rubellimicrobium sp.]|nr:hypothetical protein [Rubellimicrobium sp.]
MGVKQRLRVPSVAISVLADMHATKAADVGHCVRPGAMAQLMSSYDKLASKCRVATIIGVDNKNGQAKMSLSLGAVAGKDRKWRNPR